MEMGIFASMNQNIEEPVAVKLAEKHGLGLFNASSTGEEVWIPEDGRMALAHDKGPQTLAGRIKNFLTFE